MDKNSFILTESDKYYIENHRKESVKKLTESLNKPTELIKNYLSVLDQKDFENSSKKSKGDSPVLQKMVRKKGATVLTAESLMISEEVEKTRPYSFRPLPEDYGTTKKE